MAHQTGTTTTTDGHVDMALKLRTFLTGSVGWISKMPATYGIKEALVRAIGSSATSNTNVENIYDKDLLTYISLNGGGTDTTEGAFEMEFHVAVTLTGFYMANANHTEFDVEYYNGADWVSVYSGSNHLGFTNAEKFVWSTAASSTKWRIHWPTVQWSSGSDISGLITISDWRFFTGASSDQEVPEWTLMYELEAPGIASYTQPSVQFAIRQKSVIGVYNLIYRVGVDVGGGFANQSKWEVVRLSGDTPSTYWITAGAWYCNLVAKTGSTYDSGIMGLATPYSPAQYHPFPGVVGGCTYATIDIPVTSDSTLELRPWFDPSGTINSPLYATNPFGNWISGNHSSPYPFAGYIGVNPHYSYVRNGMTGKLKRAPDDTVAVLPMILFSNSTEGPNVYGEIEGMFFTFGLEAQPETTLLIGGVTYMIFPFGTFTDAERFFAMRLN